jgi:acetyl esterase
MASPMRTKAETLILRGLLGLPTGVQRALLRRPMVMDGQTLAPELQLMLKLQKLTNEPALGVLPVAESRVAMQTELEMIAGKQPIGALRDLVVDGAAGALAARLYIPSARFRAEARPTLLFFHGGGMALGDLESHDATCRHLAERSGVQVLSVEYALAPEKPFPAGVDDCFAAYEWLVKNTDAVDADPARLAVGGDSAGGYMAAMTALAAAEAGLPLAFQLLAYPVTDLVNRSRSRELFDGGGLILEREGMDQLTDWYLASPEDAVAASPLLRTGLPSGIAPALVATAGFDPLRDEGEAYGRMLAEHGVRVEIKRYPSMVHGFLSMVGVGREARANAADVADRLRTALG